MATPVEGSLYKALNVSGHNFELCYGYYDERERELCPPVVIFPDLAAAPRFTADGRPLVTQIQDPCPYFSSVGEEYWCGDCRHYTCDQPEIGICNCPHNLRGGNRK